MSDVKKAKLFDGLRNRGGKKGGGGGNNKAPQIDPALVKLRLDVTDARNNSWTPNQAHLQKFLSDKEYSGLEERLKDAEGKASLPHRPKAGRAALKGFTKQFNRLKGVADDRKNLLDTLIQEIQDERNNNWTPNDAHLKKYLAKDEYDGLALHLTEADAKTQLPKPDVKEGRKELTAFTKGYAKLKEAADGRKDKYDLVLKEIEGEIKHVNSKPATGNKANDWGLQNIKTQAGNQLGQDHQFNDALAELQKHTEEYRKVLNLVDTERGKEIDQSRDKPVFRQLRARLDEERERLLREFPLLADSNTKVDAFDAITTALADADGLAEPKQQNAMPDYTGAIKKLEPAFAKVDEVKKFFKEPPSDLGKGTVFPAKRKAVESALQELALVAPDAEVKKFRTALAKKLVAARAPNADLTVLAAELDLLLDDNSAPNDSIRPRITAQTNAKQAIADRPKTLRKSLEEKLVPFVTPDVLGPHWSALEGVEARVGDRDFVAALSLLVTAEGDAAKEVKKYEGLRLRWEKAKVKLEEAKEKLAAIFNDNDMKSEPNHARDKALRLHYEIDPVLQLAKDRELPKALEAYDALGLPEAVLALEAAAEDFKEAVPSRKEGHEKLAKAREDVKKLLAKAKKAVQEEQKDQFDAKAFETYEKQVLENLELALAPITKGHEDAARDGPLDGGAAKTKLDTLTNDVDQALLNFTTDLDDLEQHPDTFAAAASNVKPPPSTDQAKADKAVADAREAVKKLEPYDPFGAAALVKQIDGHAKALANDPTDQVALTALKKIKDDADDEVQTRSNSLANLKQSIEAKAKLVRAEIVKAKNEKGNKKYRPFFVEAGQEVDALESLKNSTVDSVLEKADKDLDEHLKTMKAAVAAIAKVGVEMKEVKKALDDETLKKVRPSRRKVLHKFDYAQMVKKRGPRGPAADLKEAQAVHKRIEEATEMAKQLKKKREEIATKAKKALEDVQKSPYLKTMPTYLKDLQDRIAGATDVTENGEDYSLTVLEGVIEEVAMVNLDAALPDNDPNKKNWLAKGEQRATNAAMEAEKERAEWEGELLAYDKLWEDVLKKVPTWDKVKQRTPLLSSKYNNAKRKTALKVYKEAKKYADKGQYGTALSRLREARGHAEQLLANPLSAKATARGELKKVNQRWREAVSAFSGQALQLGEAIQREEQKDPQPQQPQQGGQGQVPKSRAQQATDAAAALSKVARSLNPAAFDKEVATLAKRVKKDDKADARKQKEAALRRVRHYQKLVKTDKVLAVLRQGRNPFGVPVNVVEVENALKDLSMNLRRSV